MFNHSLVVVVSAASMMLLIAVSLHSSLTTFWGRLDVQLSSDASPPGNGRHGQLGAVASENRNCSQMGAEMMKMGGTAADAVSILVFYLSLSSPIVHFCGVIYPVVLVVTSFRIIDMICYPL